MEPQPRMKEKDAPLTIVEIGMAMNLLVCTAEQHPTANPKSPPTMKPMIAPWIILSLAPSILVLNLFHFLANLLELSKGTRFLLYFSSLSIFSQGSWARLKSDDNPYPDDIINIYYNLSDHTILPFFLPMTLFIPSTKSALNFLKPNLFNTCYLPLLSFFFYPERISHNFVAHSSLVLQRYPHPQPTDSLGPPLLSAMMGTPEYMAQHGTIPKCSFQGVQRTHSAFLSKYFLAQLLMAVQKCTLFWMLRSLANCSNSCLCSMFYGTWRSYPPATTNFTIFSPYLSSG